MSADQDRSVVLATEARPSQSIALKVTELVGGTIVNLIVGAALFTPGIMGFVHELKHSYGCDEHLHVGHIAVFVGLMVGGALVVKPAFGKTLTNIFITVSPFIPKIGGQRAGDPPAVATSTEDKTNG